MENHPNEFVYPNEANEAHQQSRTTSHAFNPPSGKVGETCLGLKLAAPSVWSFKSSCVLDSSSTSADETQVLSVIDGDGIFRITGINNETMVENVVAVRDGWVG